MELGGEDFPILCETCLGNNPYMRMTKQPAGRECKVRDTVMGAEFQAPNSDVNRQWFIRNAETRMNETGQSLIDYGKIDSVAKDALKKLARSGPYSKRNSAHICSFFVKGNCNRGKECPYRHEMPPDNGLGKQRLRDRYVGKNDPVAERMLGHLKSSEASDETVSTASSTVSSLFLPNLHESVTQEEIHATFEVYGEIKSVVVSTKSKCAFVNFTLRSTAETAIAVAQSQGGTMDVNGRTVRVTWARPKPANLRNENQETTNSSTLLVPPPGSASDFQYPSMDPEMLGSARDD